MTETEAVISQLEAVAELKSVLAKLRQLCQQDDGLLEECRHLLLQAADEAERLLQKQDVPLLVGVFGGTGTGKSSLVNALVGEEVTQSGRQRPTTKRPVLVVHEDVDLSLLKLPEWFLKEVEVVRRAIPFLKNLALLDCPDPDTTEQDFSVESSQELTSNCGSSESDGTAEAGTTTNLERLRRLVPLCEVLIYTVTQQKYRSACVLNELRERAPGRRLLFVQTHASCDEDIREDWQKQLAHQFHASELLFVDSVQALEDLRAGRAPQGDFARLLKILEKELNRSSRQYLRPWNVLDLLHSAIERCVRRFQPKHEELRTLSQKLQEVSQKAVERFAEQVKEEKNEVCQQWEWEVLQKLLDLWEGGAFPLMLRLYLSLRSLVTLALLMRARTVVQAAAIGAVQAANWLLRKTKEQQQPQTWLERIWQHALSETWLKQWSMTLRGYVRDAGLEHYLDNRLDWKTLQQQVDKEALAERVQQRMQQTVATLAQRIGNRFNRWWFEGLFWLYFGTVLIRIGENFLRCGLLQPFFNLPNAQLLSLSFYIPAVLFGVLWCWLLIHWLKRKIQKQVTTHFDEFLQTLVAMPLQDNFFPELEQRCQEAENLWQRLCSLQQKVTELRKQWDSELPLVLGRRQISAD